MSRSTDPRGQRARAAATGAGPGPQSAVRAGAGGVSRRGLLGLAGSAAALVSGCTALPSSGEVQESNVVVTDTNALIETAPGPVADASPEEIVRGFLRAVNAGFSDGFDTARQFLTGEAAEHWRPLEAVQVYSSSTEPQISVAADGSIMVSFGTLGRLSADGVFAPAVQDAIYETSFSLVALTAGQWRIAGLESGILLPFNRMSKNFAVHALHFLTRDHARFIPELRWYPRDPAGLARSLVAGLIAGPSAWLAPGTDALLPGGAALSGEGVVLQEDRALVLLNSQANPGDRDSRALVAAQIQQTLSQISGITRVEVRAGSVELGPAASLPSLSPDIGGVVGMVEGGVVRGTGTTRSTLATAQALGTTEAGSPVLAADGSVYVLSASSLLRLPQGSSAASVILSVGDPAAGAGGLKAPIADRHGWVWLLAEGQLAAVNASGQRVDPRASWFEGDSVEAFDLSVESERLAVRLASGAVVLAVVLRDGNGQPTGIGPGHDLPRAGGAGASGISWCTATSVGTLVQPEEADGLPEVRMVQAGGPVTTMIGVRSAHSVIADRSEEMILLNDDKGQTWQRRGATWRVLTDEVTDLSFPLP
ncbi:GerMN domain-containing protein [Actinomyces bowdenii]|uniref:Spore gernimation protein n=1 Tax=Actinomyces bowdenii TaxID=131109 RepID=A0A3P1URH4_9ACTO|nr:GerMN domain-containing protein [Actinomyces bowdenii]RRD24431.1 spore gernimation protein [Actinomyces bowdenii]